MNIVVKIYCCLCFCFCFVFTHFDKRRRQPTSTSTMLAVARCSIDCKCFAICATASCLLNKCYSLLGAHPSVFHFIIIIYKCGWLVYSFQNSDGWKICIEIDACIVEIKLELYDWWMWWKVEKCLMMIVVIRANVFLYYFY